MEIKLELEDSPNFAPATKISSVHNSNRRIKTEVSNSDVASPSLIQEQNQPCTIFIKQEDYKPSYENEDLNQIFPKCENFKRKQFGCSLCIYSTDRRKNLFIHRETHKIKLPSIPFKCDNYPYKPRKKTSEKKNKKHFYCNSCGFKAAGLTRFQMLHELVCHKVEKPFTCSSCNYKCVTQSALTDHLVIHIGRNPFPCSICRYRTNSKEKLEMHVISHKPLVCIQCDYRCATQATLNRHLKSHSQTEDQLDSVVESKTIKMYSKGSKRLQTVKIEEVYVNDLV